MEKETITFNGETFYSISALDIDLNDGVWYSPSFKWFFDIYENVIYDIYELIPGWELQQAIIFCTTSGVYETMIQTHSGDWVEFLYHDSYE